MVSLKSFSPFLRTAPASAPGRPRGWLRQSVQHSSLRTTTSRAQNTPHGQNLSGKPLLVTFQKVMGFIDKSLILLKGDIILAQKVIKMNIPVHQLSLT